jgi:hypothetical protein
VAGGVGEPADGGLGPAGGVADRGVAAGGVGTLGG